MSRRDILIILGVIIVLNIVIMVIFNITPETTLKSAEYEISGGVGPGDEKRLKLENISAFQGIAGEMVTSKITGMVTDIFEKNLPTFKAETIDMTDAQLVEFFNNNKIRIRQELHLEDKDNFVNLIKKARTINCPLEDFDSCKFTQVVNTVEFECKYLNGEKITGVIEGRTISLIRFKF